jgi:hypothetical protein
MRTTYLVSILVVALIIVLPGCKQQSETVTPPPSSTPVVNEQESPPAELVTHEKSILAESAQILDILSLLPDTFQSVDPASIQKSKEDLGITNPSCSEVQAFRSEVPYQIIWCFLCESNSSDSEDIRISEDMSDEVKTSIVSTVTSEVSSLGLPLKEVQTDIQFPEIGDFALYGEGKMDIGSMTIMAGDKSLNTIYYFGFDMLGFRTKLAHVYLYSMHVFSTSTDRVGIIPIGEEIYSRISTY